MGQKGDCLVKQVLIGCYNGDNWERAAVFCHRRFDVAYFCYADNDYPSEEARCALSRLLKAKFGVVSSFRRVESYHKKILFPLLDTWSAEGQVTLDLTGADPLFASAAAFYASEQAVCPDICCFDPLSGRSRLQPSQQSVFLTVSDYIALYGGQVLSMPKNKNYDFQSPALQQEIVAMWQATRDIPNEWNRFCSLPVEPLAGGNRQFRRKLTKPAHRTACERVLASLSREGVVTEYTFSGKGTVTYACYTLRKTARTKELYEKGGTALELFTCLSLVRSGSFTSCATGVEVDLDGHLTHLPGDPKNELDVLSMYGNRPVFISCKNTRVTKEYLYEIQAVSRHVGGKYAIPVVVSTLPAYFAVSERAREMGVLLADDLHTVSLKEMTALLRGFFPVENEENE